MKWNRFVPIITAAMVMTACASPQQVGDEEVVQEAEKKVETTKIPSVQLSDDYYKTLLPVKESASRGLVVTNLYTKYDTREVETGLMRLSQREYPTSDYFIQEGQYLAKGTVQNWLGRSNKTEEGLNPSDEGLSPEQRAIQAPIYLAHIVEQDYLTKTKDNKVTLGGVSIGLALNSIYYYQKEQYGEYYEQPIEDSKLQQEGKKIAEEIYKRLRGRDELKNVPIMIGLYKQKASNDIVPGSYMSYSIGKADAKSLGDWTDIDEEYVLFPSNDNKDEHRAMNTSFQNFKLEVNKYFSNTTSVIGRGFYQNKDIKKLSLEIPIQFFGATETVGFTQFVVSEIPKHFPNNILLEISIKSMDGPEALIVRKPDEKMPFVHMYNE
ncbi:CamS family sex pheromone protein [Metalysinibacillus jejuensis]|uniref:CamS family sex pheromone protein n=1 Tax=Metalysinibacillus jejuensis TaxID=914327 RepID=UPI000D397C1C|nr:CamS family sex pheromone protein [Metalysinibacillus jejuensis]